MIEEEDFPAEDNWIALQFNRRKSINIGSEFWISPRIWAAHFSSSPAQPDYAVLNY